MYFPTLAALTALLSLQGTLVLALPTRSDNVHSLNALEDRARSGGRGGSGGSGVGLGGGRGGGLFGGGSGEGTKKPPVRPPPEDPAPVSVKTKPTPAPASVPASAPVPAETNIRTLITSKKIDSPVSVSKSNTAPLQSESASVSVQRTTTLAISSVENEGNLDSDNTVQASQQQKTATSTRPASSAATSSAAGVTSATTSVSVVSTSSLGSSSASAIVVTTTSVSVTQSVTSLTSSSADAVTSTTTSVTVTQSSFSLSSSSLTSSSTTSETASACARNGKRAGTSACQAQGTLNDPHVLDIDITGVETVSEARCMAQLCYDVPRTYQVVRQRTDQEASAIRRASGAGDQPFKPGNRFGVLTPPGTSNLFSAEESVRASDKLGGSGSPLVPVNARQNSVEGSRFLGQLNSKKVKTNDFVRDNYINLTGASLFCNALNKADKSVCQTTNANDLVNFVYVKSDGLPIQFRRLTPNVDKFPVSTARV